jgi:hypothetical protein
MNGSEADLEVNSTLSGDRNQKFVPTVEGMEVETNLSAEENLQNELRMQRRQAHFLYKKNVMVWHCLPTYSVGIFYKIQMHRIFSIKIEF